MYIFTDEMRNPSVNIYIRICMYIFTDEMRNVCVCIRVCVRVCRHSSDAKKKERLLSY